jgi:hypothetical protein
MLNGKKPFVGANPFPRMHFTEQEEVDDQTDENVQALMGTVDTSLLLQMLQFAELTIAGESEWPTVVNKSETRKEREKARSCVTKVPVLCKHTTFSILHFLSLSPTW